MIKSSLIQNLTTGVGRNRPQLAVPRNLFNPLQISDRSSIGPMRNGLSLHLLFLSPETEIATISCVVEPALTNRGTLFLCLPFMKHHTCQDILADIWYPFHSSPYTSLLHATRTNSQKVRAFIFTYSTIRLSTDPNAFQRPLQNYSRLKNVKSLAVGNQRFWR